MDPLKFIVSIRYHLVMAVQPNTWSELSTFRLLASPPISSVCFQLRQHNKNPTHELAFPGEPSDLSLTLVQNLRTERT